ncbi:hypothetical protein KKF34_16075 [Myxococcota bacterium]|nr:hypothetical protein [Myxococcota bacterium]MBU1382728.1 hypothetical protein [Myxococcota bacterium]MBU1498395.1 hypothetical protein [Myxococcota bacterium]
MKNYIVIISLIIVGCGKDGGSKTDGTNSGETSSNSPSATGASAKTSPEVMKSPYEKKVDSALKKLGLPPVDTACKSDADCVISSTPTIEDDFCCFSCPWYPANKSWRSMMVQKCNKYNGGKFAGCPKLNCRIPGTAKCENSKCIQIRKTGTEY